MTIGVDDIARISYEAARLALNTGEIPWARLSTEALNSRRAETGFRLKNTRAKYDGDPKDNLMTAVAQQLREYM